MSQKIDSIRTLSEYVSILMDKGDINKSLKLIRYMVEEIITEPLCTSQVFGSKTLDDLCQKVGRANLVEIRQELPDSSCSQQDQPIFTYVVTKLQKSGGHTRVIEDFIKSQPGAQHIILSTELNGKSDTDYLINLLAKQENIGFEPAPKESYHKRLAWLQKRLLQINPKRVYLFNHHQDSVAVAAIQPEMKLDVSFYHHGDHHLCLGMYLPCVEHIDPHPMGYHNCRNMLGIDNVYIPLTIDDQGGRQAGLQFLCDGLLTTCTAARSNKIEIPYFISYLELLPMLLKSTGGKHIHIGRLTPWALFKIRRELKRHGVKPDKFIYIPWVSSVWKALHEYRVDLYIASFPYGGGLTLIEAMGAGIPVALHRHIFSSILSGIDLAYSGALSWRSPDELLNYCTSLTACDLEQGSRLGRLQYEKHHTQEKLQGILNDLHYDRPKPNNLSEFSVESDEWALWMERQLTIGRVVSRALYRAARRFRSFW